RMPKLERLAWIAPLSEGKGVTLTDDPAADKFLAESPDGLLIGVLLDSQYPTRKAFAAPLLLRDRLGYLDMKKITLKESDELIEVFRQQPALHRFPRKFAQLTQQLAAFVVDHYGGDSSRIWMEAKDADELGNRLYALPAFGVEKTNWTVGMLGVLGVLPFDGWEEYRIQPPKGKRVAAS
ncbi:MAG TPA: hypothetical protein DEV93_11535, partial [Chloroflexi bacterium]|nr:hypothetical protein [Chloroflexota bacterium]